MENLKYSLFDLFAFAIPGVFCLTGLRVLARQPELVQIPAVITEWSEKTNVYLAVLIVLVGYVTGHILSLFASVIIHLLTKLSIFKKPTSSHTATLNNSTRYILIRELSKENFKYIEIWNVMAKLYTNIAVIFLILLPGFLFIYRDTIENWWILAIAIIGVVVVCLLFRRAFDYLQWTVTEMDNCIHEFDLTNAPRTLLQEISKKKD